MQEVNRMFATSCYMSFQFLDGLFQLLNELEYPTEIQLSCKLHWSIEGFWGNFWGYWGKKGFLVPPTLPLGWYGGYGVVG